MPEIPGRLARAASALLFALAMTLVASSAPAEPLGQPRGAVILTVSGSINERNGEDGARFDWEMLAALPRSRLETFTDWTEGKQTFEGVLLKDLLARVGGRGQSIVAHALNNYSASIPMSDLEQYVVLVATTRNAQPMPVREKGPIWIIYPNETQEQAKAGRHNAKMVWQVNRLEIR